jgi:cold shock CspA family protein
MIRESSKQKGKITYYNKITGIITSNNKEIMFHKKDIMYPINQDIIGKEVEFNIENGNDMTYVRNIRILDNNINKTK